MNDDYDDYVMMISNDETTKTKKWNDVILCDETTQNVHDDL